MKQSATIPYESLIDAIEDFSEDYVEYLSLLEELEIKSYTLQLALYLSAKFYFDK